MSAEAEIVDRLCELNVIEQVHNVCATTIVRDAWARGANVRVDGWVYSIRDGILKGLCSLGPETAAETFGAAKSAADKEATG
jgi:carbonic anhydrase